MGQTILVGLLLLTACSWAQAPPPTKQEQAAIEHTKKQLVSSIDQNLPKVTLDFFLQYESEGAPITWEVNDCGEQTGDPATDRERDIPMCVEADFDKNHAAVSIMIAVGTFKTGPSGVPELFSLSITEQDGKSRPVRHLSDLPKELHRPLPKSPRDSPAPDASRPTASSE
jgi:hypothetical protein